MTENGTKAPEPVDEVQMRLMLDAMPARIWFLDPEHKVRFANREAAALFSLDASSVIGRTARDLLGDAGFEQDSWYREEALRGKTAKWEGWTTYPDSTDRYTERIFTPHRNHDGVVDGYYEFVRDITELKRVEQEQRRTARTLRDAIESIPDGFGVFNSDEVLEICNSAYAELFDREPKALAGMTADDLLTVLEPQFKTVAGRSRSSADDVLTSHLREVRRGKGKPADVEVELEDGRWLKIGRHPTSDGGFVILRSDITERKNFEKELRESEQRFRGIAGIHPVPVVITTPQGSVLYASPAWRDLFGYGLDDLPSLDVRDTYPNPEDRDRYLEVLHREGGVDAFEIEFQTSDGHRFWASMTSRKTVFDGKEAIVAGIHDLTERKAAEQEILKQREALADSERRLRTIVESHPVPLFVTDIETGRIIYESPAAARLLGHERSGQEGHYAGDHYVNPEDRPAFIAALRRRGRVSDYDVEARRTDGSRFWASLSAQQIELDGRDAAIVSIADLTERREREKEVRQARELLEDAIESLSEGFVLYDAEDRLVTCNKQYLDYNKPHDDLLVHGATWRDITRARAERGLFKDAVGRIDSWLDEQVAERDTLDPRETELSDGRWIVLSNRRTRQGGTVTLWQDITERKRMEEALRESEELIRRVVEDCPLPILMTRLTNGEVLYESPSSRSAFGLGADDNITHIRERFANPDQRNTYLAELRERGALDEYEIEFRRTDGTTFIGAVSARLGTYRGEDVIVATTVDVTEARRRERELRQARELLEDAIQSLSEGFALYDAEDRLIMCNDRYREQNPLSAALLVPGVKWVDFIREGARRGQYVDATEDIEAFVEARLSDRRKLRADLEFQQSDKRWFRFSNQPTRQGGIVVTRTDITERKIMEEALRESEELVRRVLEAHPIPVGMSRVDDGTILYESPGLKRLFGREGEAPRTINATEFYADPKDREQYVETIKRLGAVDDSRLLFKRVDGSEFWASVSSRILDFKGEQVAVFSTIDLTEKLAAEEEIKRQRAALYQSEKLSALGSLLAGVAHELNNPLSVVVGQALLLEEVAENPRIVERAVKIGRAANRCARIVKTFLAMAREQKPSRAWTDLNDVVESALEVVGYSLRQDGVDVTLNLGRDLPRLWGDGDQLNQVITNLALNAQQALSESDRARRLTVETSYDAKADRVRVMISDNGPGIPKEVQDRIFEPFFTTKPIGSGTGIGLAFCQRIIDAHNGTITVRSRPGEGATFIIEMPPGERGASLEGLEAAADIELTDLKIVVVDDEPEVASILQEMLESLGHRPQAFTSGRAAIAYLGDNEADIIISDLRMPDVDGSTLFEWLGATRPELAERLAFMTGDHLSTSARDFLAKSDRPYIEKPVLPADLRDLIQGIVARLSDPTTNPP